jgi:lycopene beta-cyclase
MTEYDYVLVGGGLQNSLLVLALAKRRPAARVCLVETADRIGGNHTWSYHAADVPAGAETLVESLEVASWPRYLVRFATFTRVMQSRYATVLADRLNEVVQNKMAEHHWLLRLRTRASIVAANRITLDTGEEIFGRCVIDSRGPRDLGGGCGYQKFLGLEVETATPWPERLPIVMDATVPQDDGFHFVYSLPLTPTRVIVEDTYFSDGPRLDSDSVRQRLAHYLGERVSEWRVVREESGVLPMPWQLALPSLPDGPLVGGYAGGWFHPATGYSFPVALRFALAVAAVPPQYARRATAALADRFHPRWWFSRMLNRLLFQLVPPDARWQVFARLYQTLPPSILARFYALEFTASDAARILIGRPPRIDLFRTLRLSRRKPCLSPSLS